jgi:lipopolysaccharide transport system ATP-binding protein
MSTVITVENIGKRYTLHHQQREQYTALRDVLANGVRNLSKKILSPFTFHHSPLTASEDFWALKDVTFEVKQGDRIGIIGRNGAGKSTLLKILSRITEPTTGSVRIRGRVASLLEVGTGFHPELTGRENIFLNGAILGMGRTEIRKKFDEIVDFAEIEKFLDTPVKRYSSGMYVRLAFAVAAHLEPEILIVDEVLAVGDAQFQKKCLGKMEDVSAREGRTVLFVSHNMAAISQLCSLSLWMEKGNLIMKSNATEVIREYLSSGSAVASGERRWSLESSPADRRIRLLAIRVLNDVGEVSATIDMTRFFQVELEYEILQSCAGMRTGFWIYTMEGVLVFVAGDNEDRAWRERRRPEGRYRSRCTVPAGTLNSGQYSVTAAADIQNCEMLFSEASALCFTVEHTSVSTLDGSGRSPGIICPSLDWKITCLDTSGY